MEPELGSGEPWLQDREAPGPGWGQRAAELAQCLAFHPSYFYPQNTGLQAASLKIPAAGPEHPFPREAGGGWQAEAGELSFLRPEIGMPRGHSGNGPFCPPKTIRAELAKE